MFLNKITEKLQIHACYHKTYLRMYRCQLKSFFIKTIKIWKDFFSSLHIIKTNELVRRIEVKVLNVESVATKKVTVPMALGHKCKKSYRELILKWKCENAGMWQETLLQNTYVFERIFFFFARQCNPLIKQIIFQKHWFNGTAHHNNLHILYQKAMKFNMHEMINLTKHLTRFHTIFYSTIERIALGNTLIFITIEFVRKTWFVTGSSLVLHFFANDGFLR